MIHDNLLVIAAAAPWTSGLRYRGAFQSYAELVERIQSLAAGFRDRGIEAGDAVAIVMANSPELFAVCHALFAIGAIAMPLSTSATAAEYAATARLAGVRAVISDRDLGAVVTALAADLGGVSALPVFLSGAGDDWSLDVLARTPPISPAPIAGETMALYLLSSGSTGLPKIVPHSHAELLADGRRTSTAWQLTPDDVVFDMLPANFAMGLLLGAMDALAAGASTVYWNDPRPLVLARRSALETIAAEKVTVMGAVPAMYEALAGGATDPLALRMAFSGGAALRRASFEMVREKLGVAVRQDYGSTEAIMVSHNDADPDRLWDSVGRPAGDARVRIAPVETELGADVGELLIQSSSMTRGYLGDEAANAAFEDGWLRSGDLARLDADGNIFIKGRSKLLIDVAGFKIDPIEVEEALCVHPAVAEAAVAGVAAGRGALRLKAFVVRSGEISELDLVRHLRARLSVHKVPTAFEFRDALPKSSAGKVLRSRLGEDG